MPYMAHLPVFFAENKTFYCNVEAYMLYCFWYLLIPEIKSECVP